mgnify:CR=1 FL=1
MEPGDLLAKYVQICEILTKTVKFLVFFRKTRFSENHAVTDVFFKNEARRYKFGPSIWYLKICGTDF